MKGSVFWDVMLWNPLRVNGRYGEICRLHLHDQTYAVQNTSVMQVASAAYGVKIITTTTVKTSNSTILVMFFIFLQIT
jgi:hypothetical protein